MAMPWQCHGHSRYDSNIPNLHTSIGGVEVLASMIVEYYGGDPVPEEPLRAVLQEIMKAVLSKPHGIPPPCGRLFYMATHGRLVWTYFGLVSWQAPVT